jgi:hypothetical protein
MVGEETARTRSRDFIDGFNEEHIIVSGGCRSIDTWHVRIAWRRGFQRKATLRLDTGACA